MERISITGNVGRDPEMRFTPSGSAVTVFSIAVNRKYTKGDGEQVKETKWFNVEAWNKQAESVNQWVKKGQKLYVEGTMKADPETGGPRIWEDKQGKARSSFEIRCTSYEIMDWGDGGNGTHTDAVGNQAANAVDQDYPYPEDDIPF